MELSEKDEEYIISLLKQGNKINAITFIKDKTGVTLKEAKDYIDKKANNEYYEKNISISKEDEEYICSLINENKKLQAVAFLHKNKNMSLLEAKNYVDSLAPYKEKDMAEMNSYFDNSNNRSSYKSKEIPTRRGHIFDKKLNMFIPNLDRQRKFNKVIFYIL